MATLATERVPARTFYRRMAAGLAIFIIFGFLQFELRGLADIRHMPLIFHAHGGLMITWLALFVTQANLPSRGAAALHKSLGWTSVVMAPAIVVLALATCITALRMGVVPPFFSGPFFLSLNVAGGAAFLGLVLWAVAWRKRAEWHRRLMLGSLVIIMEPALGRLLPAPLIGGNAAEWVAMGIQLLVPAAMMHNDRKTRGTVHPASLAVGVVIIFTHLVIEFLPQLTAWQDFTARVVG